jgi:hypothetical protein
MISSIPNFDRAFILRVESNRTLPGSVWKKLTTPEGDISEGDRLLDIIEKFEKNPTDLKAKEEEYPELLKLFYKGIGLKEDGTGTISEENEIAAFQLSDLINDAILHNQQNTKNGYTSGQLKDALKLQNKFREDLEKTDFSKLLKKVAKGGSNTKLSEGQKEYQTEKITSYLAENNKAFAKIFQKLSQPNSSLTVDEELKLKNLKTLADGPRGRNILNDILRTFNELKDYSFTDANLKAMKKAPTDLLDQADTASIYDNWEKRGIDDGKLAEKDDNKEKKTSRRGSTDRILEKILARLEKLENQCAEKETEKQASTTPDWLSAISGIATIASNIITGLGNNNQNYCCYPPVPCSGRGSAYCPPPRPYYVGGNTWPWGSTNGCSAFNNYMPSSGSYSATSNPSSTVSSNPYSNSSSSAYNPINIELKPVFNNNNSPNQTSSSASYSGSRSSNAAEIRRSFGINMPGIRRT